MEGKTKKGFEFKIEESAFDNMELVESIAGIEKNPLLLPKICELLFGKVQKKRLYDYYRTEDGRVPIQDISDAIEEIFNMSDETKN